jgi:DNA-binding transcriptional LysR family regulator
MTYDQLVTLDSIVKNGSFKAAAQAMHKSQPSISIAIKKLEEEFQIQIFDRQEYRPKLTPEGKAFYKKALISLKQFGELKTFANELAKGAEPEINLAIDSIVPISKIQSELVKFFDPYISTSLNLTVDILEGIAEDVVDHEVDFAIGSYFVERADLDAYHFTDVEMLPVISSTFDLDNIDLKTLPQIVITSNSKNRSDELHGVLSDGKRWFTSDISMKLELIKNELGWGRMPCHLVERAIANKELVVIEGHKNIQKLNVPLYLLRSKSYSMGPNAKRLWEHLLSISV